MKKINTTKLKKRAAEDTAKKISLEPHLAKDMKTILRRIVKHFQMTYPHDRDASIPHKFTADVTSSLRDHYRRVTKAFVSYGDKIVQLNGSKSIELKSREKIKANVDRKLGNYILEHSDTQAKIIIKTTEHDLHKAISKAVSDSVRTGNSIDSSDIADTVSKNYLKQINGRADIISMTETQSMAEHTKDVEMDEVEDMPDNADRHFGRVWVAILDQVTRDWHAEADGQTAEGGEPFIVMGEELEYPGDPDGSPENIINCRCCSVPIEI